MASLDPGTVFGLTAYNGEEHLAEALESLLGQTRADLAIVVVDDCSTDGTGEIARRYAQLDPRVVYERNDRQLGLVRNWRRAFDLAGERFPGAAYFAWASDHDVWHDRWLEALAAELDAHPEAVLAYPLAIRIDDFGSEYPTGEQRFDTAGLAAPGGRVLRVAGGLTGAGEIVYGLARRAALERCGPFPLVVLADRLHLIRLAVEGEFRQVPRRLWYRRHRSGVTMSNARQRRASFPDGAPLWAYLPWWLTHARLFHASVGDARLTRTVLRGSVAHAWERRRARTARERRWRRRERRRRSRGLARTAAERLGLRGPVPAARVSPRDEAEPPISEALEALEQAELLGGLAEPGAVVLAIGGGAAGLVEQLSSRFPELRSEIVTPQQLGSAAFAGTTLAVSIAALGNLSREEAEDCAARLRAGGAPVLYCLDRESAELWTALGRWYWLHGVWAPSSRQQGARKPDPAAGPVPRPAGGYRHVIGRLRLVPRN